MSKLLFIGVDALDAVQVERLAHRLPNIMYMRQSGFYSQFGSVWPPDSETAWSSIYTGWNPARHGISQFVDPLQKTTTFMMRERNNGVFRGATFWDIAGAAGRRVCVLFPHVGYPSWDVNGVMITRASIEKEISVTPSALLDRYDFQGLNDVKGLAGRRREQFLEANRRLVERQLDITLDLLRTEDWDLFFTYWSALDLVQHQFWNYYDPEDPSFPGDTPFIDAIPDFYALHDHVVGALVAAVGSDATVIVMSDHGHGMRPAKIFNINRLLWEHGFLALRHRSQNPRMSFLKTIRKQATQIIGRYELGGIAANLLKLAPWTKKLYLSAADIDFDKTVAYITDMSGIKAYSYGGIRIARQNLHGRPYANVRDEVQKLLGAARNPEWPSEPLVRWIVPREEVYSGPYLDDYPDLIFELHPDYGAGWDASGPLFDTSYSHNLYPGSHIRENAVFLLCGPDLERVVRAPDSMMDVAPTVLDVLGVPVPPDLDGRSILCGSRHGVCHTSKAER